MLKPTSWARGPLTGFDLETTGVNVEEDRIVTASVILVEPSSVADQAPRVNTYTWLVDPGIEIPAGATKVHGITTEHARDSGRPATVAVAEIHQMLAEHWTEHRPLIAFNGSYDLTLLDRECRRHCGDLEVKVGDRCLIDPLCIDRTMDRYRKGGRKLAQMCKYYGVPLGDDAHSADADALATMRLAFKLAAWYPDQVGNLDLGTLHERQRGWNAAWCRRMSTWLEDEAGKLERAWRQGERAFVLAKLRALEITDEPDEALIEQACADTRRRAAEFLAGRDRWPMHPRPSYPQPVDHPVEHWTEN